MQTDRIEEYAAEHSSREPEGLALLARRSNLQLINGQMVSGHLQGRMLRMLTAMIRPARVLELGTFSGYSALCMAEALEENARLGLGPVDAYVDTVEADDELEDFLRREAIPLSPVIPGSVDPRVHLHFDDALAFMDSLTLLSSQSDPESPVGCRGNDEEPGLYDMIFIDADKRQYPQYYEAAKRLLRKGGYIIADNTLWYGHVIDPAYDRDAQTLGIRRFNEIVAVDPEVECVMVPLRDGLTLIRKL